MEPRRHEIAVGDGPFMDILQACNIRVGSKNPKVFGLGVPRETSPCASDNQALLGHVPFS